MPTFQANQINNHIEQATPGIPVYLFGAFSYITAATRMTVTAVAIASDVATVSVIVTEGNIPVAGQLVSVKYASPSAVNVDSVAIASASITAATGIGMITYNLPAGQTNQATTASAGLAIAPVAATTDVFANKASVPVAIQQNTGPNNGRSIRCDVTIPSLPTTGTVVVQTAVGDPSIDANYVTLGTVASVTGGVLAGATNSSGNVVSAIFTQILADFVRYKITGTVGGSSPTIIATVTV